MQDKFGRTLYKAKCSECGLDTEVPFEPDPSRPIYCRNCYSKRKKRSFRNRGR